MNNIIGKVAGTLIASLALSLLNQAMVMAETESPWADWAPEARVQVSYATAVPVSYQRSSAVTRTQGLALSRTVSGMPAAGTHHAPSSLALRAVGKSHLPPTRLESFVANSGNAEAIYGMEDNVKNVCYMPIESGFDEATQEGLTTGQQSNAPAVSTFPTWPGLE